MSCTAGLAVITSQKTLGAITFVRVPIFWKLGPKQNPPIASCKVVRYRNGTATELKNRSNENGLAEANPLFFLVGRARFELATNGLNDVVVV